MTRKTLYLFLVVLIFLFNQAEAQMKGGKVMEIKSPAFEQEGMIPERYTCDGQTFLHHWSGPQHRKVRKVLPLSMMTRMPRWEHGFTGLYMIFRKA